MCECVCTYVQQLYTHYAVVVVVIAPSMRPRKKEDEGRERESCCVPIRKKLLTLLKEREREGRVFSFSRERSLSEAETQLWSRMRRDYFALNNSPGDLAVGPTDFGCGNTTNIQSQIKSGREVCKLRCFPEADGGVGDPFLV